LFRNKKETLAEWQSCGSLLPQLAFSILRREQERTKRS